MAIPAPTVGLVIRYEYVWRREASAGRDMAVKDRPVCLVLVAAPKDKGLRIVLSPITTAPPRNGLPALEIPLKVVEHLGLDVTRRSWIVLNEANIDTWPSPDIRPIPGLAQCEYGLMPELLLNAVRAGIQGLVAENRFRTTNRVEMPQPAGMGAIRRDTGGPQP